MESLVLRHGRSYQAKKEFFFTNSGGDDGGPIVSGVEAKDIPSQSWGEKIMGEWTGKYKTEINGAAKKYNLDPMLIAAVIDTESTWNKDSKSGVGARGLMQIMPDTFKLGL
jgi:hypothetical protein